jgi:aspartate/methionine/tyrosine aminotransferase
MSIPVVAEAAIYHVFCPPRPPGDMIGGHPTVRKPDMSFTPFNLEYTQSIWEQQVDINLTESGVHPIRLDALLGDDRGKLDEILATEINYPHVNGNPDLRERIAALYDGAGVENVLVTVGAAEANNVIMQTLMEPGDELLTETPTYMQVWGLAANTGHEVKSFRLQSENAWALDVDELEAGLSEKTKIIALVNPNNPTGRILTDAEMDAVVAAADKVGAWILADEVYRGAERTREEETPSFFGRYDKVLALGSMSKAYALPGLRVGWVVGPPDTVDDIWRRHEYTTITASMLSNLLASHALSPEVRPRLLQRTRDYIRNGFPVLEAWMNSQDGLFSYTPPDASAVSFIRYHLDINSTELMEKLCREASVFVGAGDSFGMDHHLRVAFGQERATLEDAFARIERVLASIAR